MVVQALQREARRGSSKKARTTESERQAIGIDAAHIFQLIQGLPPGKGDGCQQWLGAGPRHTVARLCAHSKPVDTRLARLHAEANARHGARCAHSGSHEAKFGQLSQDLRPRPTLVGTVVCTVGILVGVEEAVLLAKHVCRPDPAPLVVWLGLRRSTKEGAGKG